jgi:excisionase family DNA binding protein
VADQEPNEDHRPLTVEEAATIAGVGRGAMYAAVKDGTVPSLRLGRRILIPRKAFLAWLDGTNEENQ